MNIQIDKNVFLKPLALIQGITGRKSNFAITQTALLRTGGNSVIIEATDLQTGYSGTHDAHVDRQGAAAVNSKKLFEIIKSFPVDDIEINMSENHWMTISGGSVKYNLFCMKEDDFPEFPKIDEISYSEVDSENISLASKRACAIRGDSGDKRAHIMGAYIDYDNIVSTDGNRLALSENVFDGLVFQGLVPKTGLADLIKFVEGEKFVQVGFLENHMIVKKEFETITIRLLEGDFPDYGEIVKPAKNADCIVFDRTELIATLKRVSIVASDTYKGVIFSFFEGGLTVKSTNPDLGDCSEMMKIAYSGESKEAAYNPNFIVDILNTMASPMINFHFVDGESPAIITGDLDNNFSAAIMPMRI